MHAATVCLMDCTRQDQKGVNLAVCAQQANACMQTNAACWPHDLISHHGVCTNMPLATELSSAQKGTAILRAKALNAAISYHARGVMMLCWGG